ncbi:MAG: hypothetical protein P0S94_03390 [Simkaniaceae bacterium]|nr:hypothetical protein [Simkaniaceae bacterium]
MTSINTINDLKPFDGQYVFAVNESSQGVYYRHNARCYKVCTNKITHHPLSAVAGTLFAGFPSRLGEGCCAFKITVMTDEDVKGYINADNTGRSTLMDIFARKCGITLSE